MRHFSEKLFYTHDGAERDVSLLGALPCTGTLRFCLSAPETATGACLAVHSDGWGRTDGEHDAVYAMARGETGAWDVVLPLEELARLGGTGLYYYEYRVTFGDRTVRLGGEAVAELCEVREKGQRQLMLYEPSFQTPSFFRGGFLYHIFVDRFFRSGKSPVRGDVVFRENWNDPISQYGAYPGAPVANNEFFGGDLYGVTEKLDYLESLSVTALYLSPVFTAASNHKYDTADYMTVDAMFGGEKALKTLCDEARKRGMSVILDGVFNHTGADSVYFNKFGTFDSVGAYQSPSSPYAPWYDFKHYPDDYACWWGVKILPKVNCDEPSYRAFLFGENGVIRHWMRLGVAGFRLDVVDEVSDDFVRELRRVVREENPDGIVLGEVWEDASDKIAYGKRRGYFYGDELDSVMNYPLRDGLIAFLTEGDCEKLRAATEGLYRRYPKRVSDVLMNFLGTHDTERIVNVLGGDVSGERTNDELAVSRMSDGARRLGLSRLRSAYAVLFFMFGVPSVFYGDEAGLEGYRDPFCRRPFPWGGEDEDLVSYVRRLGALRKSLPVLREGWFCVRECTPKVFAFDRYDDETRLAVVVTRGASYTLKGTWIDLLTGKTVTDPVICAGGVGCFKKIQQ